jgi:Domain of unknown function (DUF4124)
MASKTFTIIATLAASAATLALRPAAAQDSPPPSTPAAAASGAPANDGPTRAGQTMYRWVDKDKTVHYSDRPQPGADSVPVQSTQTYSAPKAPPVAVRNTAAPAPPVASCAITSPTSDQVFPNAQSVTVSYTGPKGGKAELLLNGASRQTLPAGTAFSISPVPRGSYSATVAITSDTGAALCRTPSVTFHVTQPSLLSPVRQQMNRPRPR